MRAAITKRFDFHAAHVLPSHNGQCARLHGHSYEFEVTVVGEVQPPSGASGEGMVVDFSALKDVYKSKIEPFVEHQFLNSSLAGLLPTLEVDRGGGPEALTTAENIAWWILQVYRDVFKHSSIKVAGIQLWETKTSSVSVFPSFGATRAS